MRYTCDRSLVLEAFSLGETQSFTPEGYLYCRNVPIARTGIQQYLNEELEPDAEGGPDGIIHVERLDEDVFHPDTLASLEGKPITVDHPEEMLSPETVRDHQVGTVINVRRGENEHLDKLLADLLITDKDAIAAVRAGKRQVSVGYGAEYKSLGPGRARQHTIICNHLALVGRGRCGPSCAIGDQDMVNKVKDEAKGKTFFQRLKSFMDAEGYKEGEEGELTLDESVPSKSGMEASSSVGGDTHIHIHAGPNGATTIAPTTDDEGTAEEMEEETDTTDADKDDEKKEFMDAMSKAYDAQMKKMRDKKTADKKASKDADKDDEDEDDKETKDADTEEEGEAESEGSVKSADADPDKDDEDEDDKETKDKKGTKDKKTTKDSAPLKSEFKELLSDVEVLAPGLSLPTFDSAKPQVATMDSMCLLRRRALAASNATEPGKEVLMMLNGGKPLDLKKLTCDNASVFFNSAVTFARDRNTDTGSLRKSRPAKDKAAVPTSPSDFNRQAEAFYAGQKPKPKSA